MVGPLISYPKLLGNISRKFAVDTSQTKKKHPVNLFLLYISQINLIYLFYLIIRYCLIIRRYIILVTESVFK